MGSQCGRAGLAPAGCRDSPAPVAYRVWLKGWHASAGTAGNHFPILSIEIEAYS